MPVPDLEVSPTIYCSVEDCPGVAHGDGTSWWCETCDATWNYDGTGGETAEETTAKLIAAIPLPKPSYQAGGDNA